MNSVLSLTRDGLAVAVQVLSTVDLDAEAML
jgi:hypothetical protein